MRTTPIYRVMTQHATVIADFVSESAALYEMGRNETATHVMCGPRLVAQKKPANHRVRTMNVTYVNLQGDEVTQKWVSGASLYRVWDAAMRFAPTNYMIWEIIAEDGERMDREDWDFGIPF